MFPGIRIFSFLREEESPLTSKPESFTASLITAHQDIDAPQPSSFLFFYLITSIGHLSWGSFLFPAGFGGKFYLAAIYPLKHL